MSVLLKPTVGTVIKPVVPKPVVKPVTAPRPISTTPVPTGSINRGTIGNSTPGTVGSTNPATGGIANPGKMLAGDPLTAYLGSDSLYQGQMSAIQKALADYQANMAAQQGNYNSQYAMDTTNIGTQRGYATEDQNNDFAGRGLLRSGLYANALGRLQGDYSNRQSQLDLNRSQYLSGLNRDYLNFQSEENLAQGRAKQDAIARRAAGLAASQ